MSEESYDPLIAGIDRLTTIMRHNFDTLFTKIDKNISSLLQGLKHISANVALAAVAIGNTIIGAKLGETPGVKEGKLTGKTAFEDAINYFHKVVGKFTKRLGMSFGDIQSITSKTTATTTKATKAQKKQKKGLVSVITSMGKMALMSAVMAPIGAMFGAIFEPVSILTPLFESWGLILSQLLVPIVIALMEALMPITPMMMELVTTMMPIAVLLVSIINAIAPLLEFLIALATWLISVSGYWLNLFGVFSVGFEGLAAIFDSFFGYLSKYILISASIISTAGEKIGEFWTKVLTNIQNTGDYVWEAIAKFFSNIGDWFVDEMRHLGDVAKEETKAAFGDILGGVTETFEEDAWHKLW